ncbi:MAG: DUF1488 family protein [Alphaproteobacteria bacterium]|nr:DUF1488 family protein [Alphaproteobacteria bacterium]
MVERATLKDRQFVSKRLAMVFRITYRGRAFRCTLPRLVQEDLDSTSYTSMAEFEAAFDARRDLILARTQRAIDAGRGAKGDLILTRDDLQGA